MCWQDKRGVEEIIQTGRLKTSRGRRRLISSPPLSPPTAHAHDEMDALPARFTRGAKDGSHVPPYQGS